MPIAVNAARLLLTPGGFKTQHDFKSQANCRLAYVAYKPISPPVFGLPRVSGANYGEARLTSCTSRRICRLESNDQFR
jgi:hypothetical protein